jgi:acetolactate decarboxylase
VKLSIILIGYTVLLMTNSYATARQADSGVKIIGAMKNVMWNGQLYGNIYLDTIADKQHLYGLGPVEYLSGELLIFDGSSYKSTVLSEMTMKVEETYKVQAPFFGYENIDKWEEQRLPDSVQTMKQLEVYLDRITGSARRPFMFKIASTVDEATIHIVNLPQGTIVKSPNDAHLGQTNFSLKDEEVDILGFFSTDHKAVFTHHDTYLHMHLITSDRKKMGHLDYVFFKKGTIKLFLPAE